MNKDKSIDMLKKLILTLILALGLGMSVSSCSFIGGVFKTGMDAGIFITVAVVVLVIILILRLRRRSN